MLHFFIPLQKIPTVTYQQKRVTFIQGRPVFYEDTRLKEARALFTSLLMQHRPKEKIQGPIQLVVKWCFGTKEKKKLLSRWKITKPDTDNLNKLLKDCMTDCGYWNDDSQVCSEVIEKFYNDQVGIFIQVMQL